MMILASENPDLFAACLFVDGQWDSSVISALSSQTFCYFAAEGDTRAYKVDGIREWLFQQTGVGNAIF